LWLSAVTNPLCIGIRVCVCVCACFLLFVMGSTWQVEVAECISENMGRSSREVYERHTIQDLASMSITRSIHIEDLANRSIEDLAAIPVVISMGSPPRALCCNLSVKHNMWLAAEASLEYMDHERLSTEYWAADFARRKRCAGALTCWASLVLPSADCVGHGMALDKGNRRFYRRRQRRLLRRVFWGWAHEVNLSSHDGQHQPALHPLQQEPLQTYAQRLHPQNSMNGPVRSMGWDACHEVTTSTRGHAHKLNRYNKEVLDWNAGGQRESAQVPEVAPSQVSRQQLNSLMNAAARGPYFLEKRILHLYQSGELNEGTNHFQHTWARPVARVLCVRACCGLLYADIAPHLLFLLFCPQCVCVCIAVTSLQFALFTVRLVCFVCAHWVCGLVCLCMLQCMRPSMCLCVLQCVGPGIFVCVASLCGLVYLCVVLCHRVGNDHVSGVCRFVWCVQIWQNLLNRQSKPLPSLGRTILPLCKHPQVDAHATNFLSTNLFFGG